MMFIEEKATNQSIGMRKLVYGVGINDASYITTKKSGGSTDRCPFYVKWLHMLERCYSPSFQSKNPAYRGCSVCDDWLTFSIFREWMKGEEWVGMSLDKDLIKKGNKIYSPSRCIFVTQEVNSIISKFGGDSPPKGISFSYNRYSVQCSVNGKQEKYGRYKTKKEAEDRYAEVKSEAVSELAMDQDDYVAGLLFNYFGMN